MLSVILKNSILMLLLTLIVHFTIINYISDLQHELHRTKRVNPNLEIPSTIVSTLLDDSTFRQPTDNEDAVKKNTSSSSYDNDIKEAGGGGGEQNCDNQFDELYDFVYGDKEADDQLTKMFSNKIKPCDFENKDLLQCSDQPYRDEIALCKNDIDNHYDNKALNCSKVTDDDNEITKDGNPIIFTYSESTNDLLNGYESFGSSFMMLKN